MRFRTACLACGVFALGAALSAQKKFVLTIDNIMRGPGLAGYEPQNPRWSGDNRLIYFEWKQAADPVLKPLDTYVVRRDGSELRKLSEDEAKLAPPSGGHVSEDRSKIAFVRDGDVFVFDLAAGKVRQITKTADVESNAGFTRDGNRVWFTRNNNLYAMSLSDGMLEQLTEIRPAGAAPAETAAPGPQRGGGGRGGVGGGPRSAASSDEPQKGTDSQEFLKKEERELLEIIRLRAALREENEARRKRNNKRKPFTLQARQTVESLSLSPDGKVAVAVISEAGQGAKTTIIPNFVTESAYTEDISSRGKVGDVQARNRMALIGVEDGAVTWVDHGQKERELSLGEPEWSAGGTQAVINARATDNKDRWILALDEATGKTRVLASLHDDAWVGGPGATALGWMKNDRDVYYQSERDGYSHLYTVPFEGGEPRQLTSGRWEVQNAKLSNDKSKFYLTTNEGDPAEVHLYSMPAEGGARTRLTTPTCTFSTRAPRAGAWRRASSRPGRFPSTRAWAYAPSAARRRPLRIPTTSPRPRCSMLPAPCGQFRLQPRVGERE